MTCIRVLVVDDQRTVREQLRIALNSESDMQVVGTARDPYEARDLIVRLKPDVVTLDVEMPRMNGVEFLRKLIPQYPIPVIMVSSLTRRGQAIAIECLELGAIDCVSKPDGESLTLDRMLEELKEKIRAAARVDFRHIRSRRLPHRVAPETSASFRNSAVQLVAVGASTGGTVAIHNILRQLPSDFPGMVIVQHMPPGFTKMFADRLNETCAMDVSEAKPGDIVSPGRVLIAPADRHMIARRSSGAITVDIFHEERHNGHRPSVDILFHSIAYQVDPTRVVGVLLTGMGTDGARGLLALRDRGARTLGQDKESSVVYGMPRAAQELGAVEMQLPVESMATRLMELAAIQSGAPT